MSNDEYTGLDWVKSDTALIIAGFCAFIGIIITLYNIIQHIAHYTLPDQQLHIIRIIFIIPLYAIVSWFSMMFVDLAMYFEIFRDLYEAFVIYCFLILILGYVGGEANCVSLISLKPSLKHPWPLCFLPTIPLNVKFLRFCKQSCIQFIIVKPVFAVINVIMLITGNYELLAYQIFLSVVYNISYTVALYGLLLFYLACKDDIRAFSPVRKFMAVKIIIFATYWQGLAVSYAPGIPKHTAELWNDFILCGEMSVFAIIHLYSFPWWEFKTGMPSSRDLMAKNARKVLSFKDVARDVYHNIAPAYQTYVLQTDDGTTKQYKTKTYMVGNLNDPSVHNKFMPNLTALRKKYGNGREQVEITKKNKYMLHTVHYDHDQDDSRFEVTTDYDDMTENDHHRPYIINNNRRHLEDEEEDEREEEEEEAGHSLTDKSDDGIQHKEKNGKIKNDNDEHEEKIFEEFGDLNDIKDLTPRTKEKLKKKEMKLKPNYLAVNMNNSNDSKSPDSATTLLAYDKMINRKQNGKKLEYETIIPHQSSISNTSASSASAASATSTSATSTSTSTLTSNDNNNDINIKLEYMNDNSTDNNADDESDTEFTGNVKN